ncbi:Tetraspanin-1, partial [Ophiophagus hannah]
MEGDKLQNPQIGGLVLLGIGIWVKVDGDSFEKILGVAAPQMMLLLHVGYLCITVGSILFIMGFLGCWGAVKENRCLLLVVIILIIFTAEVVCAVVVLIFSTVLKCCGFNNYADFNSSYFYQTHEKYPSLCCLSSKECQQFEIDYNKQITKGWLPFRFVTRITFKKTKSSPSNLVEEMTPNQFVDGCYGCLLDPLFSYRYKGLKQNAISWPDQAPAKSISVPANHASSGEDQAELEGGEEFVTGLKNNCKSPDWGEELRLLQPGRETSKLQLNLAPAPRQPHRSQHHCPDSLRDGVSLPWWGIDPNGHLASENWKNHRCWSRMPHLNTEGIQKHAVTLPKEISEFRIQTVFTLKSMPTVLTKSEVKESSAYRKRNDVLPTLLLPMIKSLNIGALTDVRNCRRRQWMRCRSPVPKIVTLE